MRRYEIDDMPLDNWDASMIHIVKAGKELLILSMIFKQPMSGYDIIKKIYTETTVLLDQGTVYPIIYMLEEDDIIKHEFGIGDTRTKIYRLTPKGEKIAQDRIDNFAQALNYFINLIDTDAGSRHMTNPSLSIIPDLYESN
jgi:DNA-binding PadR family transcriptional regulator